MNNKKTRHQSLYEHLESLQLEYIQAELRRKIYPKQKDKNFLDKVLKYKKLKIDDIARRNSLPSIFSSKTVKDQYRNKIWNDIGIPSFIYKDEINREEFELKDFRYYFASGSEVKVLLDGAVGVGEIIQSPNIGDEFITIKLKGDQESRAFPIDYITRIL